VLLVLAWIVALPILVLLYAILVERVLPSTTGKAVTLTMLFVIPGFLAHETWQWWSGHLNERRHERRHMPSERRHDDPEPPSPGLNG